MKRIIFLIVILPFFVSAQDWIVYRDTNSAIPSNDIAELKIDPFGNKWIIDSNYYDLVKFDGNNWIVFNHNNSPLPNDNALNSISIDKNDNKWIASGYGLFKFDNVNWTVYNKTNSCLPTNYIIDCDVDSLNNIWLMTDSGVVKFDTSQNCTIYSSIGGNGEIMIDSRNWVWVSDGGYTFSIFNGVSWQIYFGGVYTSSWNDYVVPGHLFCDSVGNVWGSAFQVNTGFAHGIFKFDGINFLVPYETVDLGAVYANSSFIAVWGAPSYSLLYYDYATWSAYNQSNSPLSGSILKLAIDQCNNLWMAGYGLYEFAANGVNNCLTDISVTKNISCKNAYPIPTNGVFYTQISQKTSSQIYINLYDAYGNKIDFSFSVIEQGNNQKMIQINLINNISGIYFYTIQDNFSIQSGRITLVKN